MKKNYFLSLILIIFLFSKCVITNTPGFYSGYKKLTAQQKNSIIVLNSNDSVCISDNNKNIVCITANNLKKCLQTKDTSIVYFWVSDCHSENCISLDNCQIYCTQHNYNLYVVAEYYDMEKMNQQKQTLINPLYTINTKYYKSDYCQKYTKLFKIDLLGNTVLNKNNDYKRFLGFSNGKLVFFKSKLY